MPQTADNQHHAYGADMTSSEDKYATLSEKVKKEAATEGEKAQSAAAQYGWSGGRKSRRMRRGRKSSKGRRRSTRRTRRR